MKSLIVIILFLVFPFTLLNAQVHQDWMARFNGPAHSDDFVRSVAYDAVGNVYITGGGQVISPDVWGMSTVKYNSSGVQQWAATFTGVSSTVEGRVIACDAVGNVYVTANFQKTGVGIIYATLKYNTSGVQQWVSYYGTTSVGIPKAMVLDDSANVYVTGSHTVKYNKDGVQQWAIPYAYGVNAIILDAAGNVYLTGGSTNDSCRTLKYNSAGILQWAAKYSVKSIGNSIALDASGNVYVAGSVNVSSTDHNYLIIKYNSSGVQQWANTYGASGSTLDDALFVKLDLSGNIIVTGNSYLAPTSLKFTTIKYNSAGVQQWLNRDTLGKDPVALRLDSDDNIYIAGSGSTTLTSTDFMTIKYNSSGVQQWSMRFNAANGSDKPTDMKIDGSGNVYVVGISDSSAGNVYMDYATVKYSQLIPTGVNIISNEIPSKYSLSQNYPNPFNPSTSIEFSLTEKSFITLKVFDTKGTEVSNLANENLTAGIYRYNFNAVNLPSGIYFYKLETDKFSETKKMILLK